MFEQHVGQKLFVLSSPDPTLQVLELGFPSAAFDPTTLPNLVAWYRADLGTFQDAAMTIPAILNGDPVGGWQDQSGNAWHITAALGFNRPTLNLGVFNGQPAVTGDGLNDILNGAFPDFPDACTVFAVARYDAGDALQCIFEAGTGVVNTGFILFYFGGTSVAWRVIVGGQKTIAVAQALPYTAVFTGWYDGTGTTQMNLWLNGVQQGPAAAGVAFDNVISNATTHALAGGVAGGEMKGPVAEIIVYSDAKGAADRGAVEAYLNSRYAIF